MFQHYFSCFSRHFMAPLTTEILNECHAILKNSRQYGIPHLIPPNKQKSLRIKHWYYYAVTVFFLSAMLSFLYTMETKASVRFFTLQLSLHSQTLLLFSCCMTSHFLIAMYKTCNRNVVKYLTKRNKEEQEDKKYLWNNERFYFYLTVFTIVIITLLQIVSNVPLRTSTKTVPASVQNVVLHRQQNEYHYATQSLTLAQHSVVCPGHKRLQFLAYLVQWKHHWHSNADTNCSDNNRHHSHNFRSSVSCRCGK